MKKANNISVKGILLSIIFLLSIGYTNSLIAQDKSIKMGDRFQINKDGSYVTFETSFFGFPIIRGSIKAYQATIFYNPEHIDATSVTIRFGSESVSTSHDKRDIELKGTSFLNAENFPAMWFQGTKVTQTDKGFDIIGIMNIKDINKEVTVHIEKPTVMRKAMNLQDMIMMKGNLSLNRKEFDLGSSSQYGSQLGDDINIEFHFLGTNYTIDYLKATYIREISPGMDHPVGIVYNEVIANGTEKGMKKMEALTKDPKYAKADWLSVLSDLGWVLMVDGHADDGLQFFSKALEYKPDHFSSLIRMGDAFVIGGHYKKALAHYQGEYELDKRKKFTHIPHMIKLLSGKFDLTNMK